MDIEELHKALTYNILWVQIVPLTSPRRATLNRMIKVVSTYPRGGRSAKSGGLCNGQEKVWLLPTFRQYLCVFQAW
jgi:hypothetical protein